MPTPRKGIKTVGDGRIVEFPTISNEAVIQSYVDFQVRNDRWRSEATSRLRAMQLRRIAEALAPALLVSATEDQVVAWHDKLTGLPETRASYTSAMHGLYRWMTVYSRPRMRVDDPSAVLLRPKIPEAKPRPMLDRHYDLALACAVSNPEMYLWLGLMGCSGLRCCEVAWMQVSDVEQLEEGGGYAHILGKGQKRRTVPIGSGLMATLQPFLRGRGPVFTRPSDGLAHTPNSVSQRVSVFLQGIGVPAPARAHAIRHRFGTDYHVIDADVFRQAQLMGHSSIDMTKRYTQIHPREAAEYIEQLTYWRMRPGGRSTSLRQSVAG